MNNSIKIFLMLFSITLFSSCCADITKEETKVLNSGIVLKNPTSIAENKSIITARVEEIILSENGSFIIKAFISKVEEDPSYPSIVMAGNTYDLTPNFQLDDDKKIISDSEKNRNFVSLSKLEAGDVFKAVIFSENLNGWFIKDVIKN